jgi:hypothetical protein
VQKKPASTAAAAPANVAVPDVCSGEPPKEPLRGVQDESSSVAGLPSVLAIRMASAGRQRWKAYLSAHETVTATAMPMPSRANSRTASDSDAVSGALAVMLRAALNHSPVSRTVLFSASQ